MKTTSRDTRQIWKWPSEILNKHSNDLLNFQIWIPEFRITIKTWNYSIFLVTYILESRFFANLKSKWIFEELLIHQTCQIVQCILREVKRKWKHSPKYKQFYIVCVISGSVSAWWKVSLVWFCLNFIQIERCENL